MYKPIGITAGASSYDIAPSQTLDPELFVGERLKANVRMDLLSTMSGYFQSQYQNHEQWLRAWLAGSGVSFRWHAAPDIRDLDVLLGIHFVGFRSANPGFLQLGNAEIAQHLNERLAADISPVVVNLASQEYFKAVDRKVLKARVIDCVFEDYKNGQYKVISFFAKKARGQIGAFRPA